MILHNSTILKVGSKEHVQDETAKIFHLSKFQITNFRIAAETNSRGEVCCNSGQIHVKFHLKTILQSSFIFQTVILRQTFSQRLIFCQVFSPRTSSSRHFPFLLVCSTTADLPWFREVKIFSVCCTSFFILGIYYKIQMYTTYLYVSWIKYSGHV